MPQQVLPDRVRAGHVARGQRLTFEFGLRYDFYSVVKEKDGRANPFFIEDNAFGEDKDNFYNPDKNNFSPRLSAAYQLSERTVLRGGFGLFYGPGQFEDRIQPIENFIERRRVQTADVPGGGLRIPSIPRPTATCSRCVATRHDRPDEYNIQYGASVSQELPGAGQPHGRVHRQPGKDMFLRGVANTLADAAARAPGPVGRPGRLQDLGLRRRAGDQRQSHHRMRLRELQRAAAQRHAAVPRRPDRRPPVPGTPATRERRRDRTRRSRRRTRSTMKPSSGRTPPTFRTRSTGRSSISCPARVSGPAAGASAAS